MKVLHTSDWHLGQKFMSRDRDDEHQSALDWLVKTIEAEKIDLLIVAGDIFDIGNPPNSARMLYYNFLKKLRHTRCRHVVITGGNHDSPLMLNAPRELLELLDIHLVGCATEDIKDQLLVLKNEKGGVEAVVAAVPFLRDQDIRRAFPGESSQERTERIKEGIVAHYAALAAELEVFKGQRIPIIATGHLYATTAVASEKQDNIYLGNIENIKGGQFPAIFDYVALGHIHRAQAIGGFEHIRYSGSLIPLSFSETKDDKAVVLLDFDKNGLKEIRELPIPLFRRLKTIEGDLATVQEKLENLHAKYNGTLPAWVEAVIESDSVIPNLDGILQDFVREMNVELVRTKLKKPHFPLDEQVGYEELDDLAPMDVFLKKCASAGQLPRQVEELTMTFRELEQWVRESKS